MVIVSDILLPKNADGILKVSDVSTSEGGDLSARTDPNNSSSSSFIRADSNNNLGVYLANGEGGGILNATEYPSVQVAGYNGTNFSSLQVGRTARLEVNTEDLNGNAQVLLGSAGAAAVLADSTITPIADPENRDGWNFTNPVAGTKFNLYYYNGTQETLTLADINSVFAKVYINNYASTSGAPFFHIYTKPQGAGDAGSFYRSKIDYIIDSSVIVGIGEQVILWGENLPNTSCNNRLIQLKTKNSTGPALPTEEVLYIALGTDSGASINEKNITVSSLGFNTIDLGGGNGIINREFKLITGGSGGATETTLSALNNKITQGEGDIAAGGNGLQQILCYGKDQSGNLDPLNVDNNGHLKITLNDIEAGILNSINVNPSVTEKEQVDIFSVGASIGASSSLTSSSLELKGHGKAHIFIKTGSTNQSGTYQLSGDGVYFYTPLTGGYLTPVGTPNPVGTPILDILEAEVETGARYIRVIYTNTGGSGVNVITSSKLTYS